MLAKGGLTLSQAEALTLGSDEAQRSILEQIENGSEASAEDIKGTLLDDRPTVALAIFPVEQYTGTITTDLFAEDETSYFDDAEQFMALQKEAVAELVKHHEESAAWVEVTQGWHIPEWQYRKARKNQKGRRSHQPRALGPRRDPGRSGQGPGSRRKPPRRLRRTRQRP